MSRLDKLRELEAQLRELMDYANTRSYALLAKQYRDTLREIDEIESGDEGDDEIALIIRKRQSATN